MTAGITSGEFRRSWDADYRRRKRRDCWLSSSKTVGAANATIRCSRSECCSPSFAWTHSLTHRRCRPIFLLDVQKLQRCVPNVGDLMPRDRGSVYMAAGTNLDLPCALLVPHLRLASA